MIAPRVTAALTLLAVFLAGAAVGIAVDRVVRPKERIKTVVASDMSAVLDKLGLTAQQRAQADSIVQRRAPRTEATMLDVAGRLRAIADSLDVELRSILTPDQRARLDSLRANRKLVLRRKSVDPGGKTVVDTVFPPRAGRRP